MGVQRMTKEHISIACALQVTLSDWESSLGALLEADKAAGTERRGPWRTSRWGPPPVKPWVLGASRSSPCLSLESWAWLCPLPLLTLPTHVGSPPGRSRLLVGADPNSGGGDQNRHLPADSAEADSTGAGEVPPPKPEDALSHKGDKPGECLQSASRGFAGVRRADSLACGPPPSW